MKDLNEFLEKSPIAGRVKLPSVVVVRDFELSYEAVRDIADGSAFSPPGGPSCDLEAGGKRIASGRIVRKRDGYYFKVAETGEGGDE